MEIELVEGGDIVTEDEEKVGQQLQQTAKELGTAIIDLGDAQDLIKLVTMPTDVRDTLERKLLSIGLELNMARDMIALQATKTDNLAFKSEMAFQDCQSNNARLKLLSNNQGNTYLIDQQLADLQNQLAIVTQQRDSLQLDLDRQVTETMDVVESADKDKYEKEIALLKNQMMVENETLRREKEALEKKAIDTNQNLTLALQTNQKNIKFLEQKQNEFIAEKTKSRTEFEKEKTKLEKQVASFKSKATESEQKIAELSKTNSAAAQKLQQAKDVASKAIEAKNAEIANLRLECTANVNQILNERQSIQDLANRLQIENNQLSQRVESIGESGQELDTRLERISQENTLLLGENLKFTEQTIALENQNTTLNEQLITATLELETLKQEKLDLTVKSDFLLDRQEILNDEKSQLNLRLSAQERQLADLEEANTELTIEKERIREEAMQAATKVESLRRELEDVTNKANTMNEQIALLSSTDLTTAIQANSILLSKNELEKPEQQIKLLKTDLDTKEKQLKLVNEREKQLQKNLEENQKALEIQKKAAQLEQKNKETLSGLIKKASIYTISYPEGVIKKETNEGAFSLLVSTNTSPSFLFIDDRRKRMIEQTAPFQQQIAGLYTPTPGGNQLLLIVDPKWEKRYIAVQTADYLKLTKAISVGGGGGVISTKTTTTKPSKGKGEAMDLSHTWLALGSKVQVLSHLYAMNQRAWQDKALHLRKTPGEYTVLVRFYRTSLILGEVEREELTFIASNVHKINDPNYASGESYYVIDVATPDTREHLRYTNIGSLIIPAFYGHGSLEIVVTSKKSGLVVKAEDIRQYEVEADVTRPYNTKMMIALGEEAGITMYARDTGRDTFILETLLIKA